MSVRDVPLLKCTAH